MKNSTTDLKNNLCSQELKGKWFNIYRKETEDSDENMRIDFMHWTIPVIREPRVRRCFRFPFLLSFISGQAVVSG